LTALAPLTAAAGGSPPRPPATHLTRAQFVAREAGADPLRGTASLTVIDGVGLIRSGRPYVALACHCGHDGCPGWSMVHDDPPARAAFVRMFGGRP
jgi:hypothetical protein